MCTFNTNFNLLCVAIFYGCLTIKFEINGICTYFIEFYNTLG